MWLASFPAGPWQTNCYVAATQPGSECVIIDPGYGSISGVREIIAQHRLHPIAVLVTHGHLDHMFSVTPLCREHSATCWIHSDDRELLTDPLRAMSHETYDLLAQLTGGDTRFAEPEAVAELTDGSPVEVAGLRFQASHAPGHTPGSVMFRTDYPQDEVDSLLFSGDVLFAGSIGRTDLPGGDPGTMIESLRTKVLPLPDSVVVLPGHGPQTTIAVERASNPYLQKPYLQGLASSLR